MNAGPRSGPRRARALWKREHEPPHRRRLLTIIRRARRCQTFAREISRDTMRTSRLHHVADSRNHLVYQLF
jgi:hypothetical protein